MPDTAHFYADSSQEHNTSLTIGGQDDMLGSMRILPIVLLSGLLISCGNKEQAAPAPQQKADQQAPCTPAADTAAPQQPYTYTAEEKAKLFALATGVEKLLRTNPSEYDCTQNEQAWNDEEFLRRYNEATACDMESFLKDTFEDDIVQEGLEDGEKEALTAEARKCISELQHAAKTAYTASLAWFEADIRLGSYTRSQEVIDTFRLLLRQRLLADLFVLGNSEGSCRWCSHIPENPDMESVVDLATAPFEAGILNRSALGGTPAAMKYQGLALLRFQELIRSYRAFIIDSNYRNKIHILIGQDEEVNTPETTRAIELFLAAEAAWGTYLQAITNAHTPINIRAYAGSGTEMFISEFRLKMHVSHMAHLSTIVECAGGGVLTYSEPIDFTASEDTPQAAKARANIPG